MQENWYNLIKDIFWGRASIPQLFVLICTISVTIYTYYLSRPFWAIVVIDFQPIGSIVVLGILFLIWISTFQIIRQIAENIIIAYRNKKREKEQYAKNIEIFHRLSNWQKSFIIHHVESNQRQFVNDWRIFEFEFAEIGVLAGMRIISPIGYLTARTYLFDECFFDTIQAALLNEKEEEYKQKNLDARQ